MNIPLQTNSFLSLIMEKLGEHPVDFSEKMAVVQNSRTSKERILAAGVLLLMFEKECPAPHEDQRAKFSFLLIKRSSKVAQPGDLSCPGGMLNPFIDPMLRLLITCRMLPIFRGKARKYAQNRDLETFRFLTLFLANALRETWEEINLCPLKIDFLGSLPTYSLHLFRRMIFPLVGFVSQKSTFHPNNEVERIVDIPLGIFFHEENYATYQIDLSDSSTTDGRYPMEFPCLIYRDDLGNEDILWGATYYIIMNFLHIVFGYTVPKMHPQKVIKKILSSEYVNSHSR